MFIEDTGLCVETYQADRWVRTSCKIGLLSKKSRADFFYDSSPRHGSGKYLKSKLLNVHRGRYLYRICFLNIFFVFLTVDVLKLLSLMSQNIPSFTSWRETFFQQRIEWHEASGWCQSLRKRQNCWRQHNTMTLKILSEPIKKLKVSQRWNTSGAVKKQLW